MNLLEGVRIALDSLRSHKLRTFLTLLGNIVGTMSVIAVVSVIGGIDMYARQEVLDEGTDVFSLQRLNPIEFLTDMDAFIRSLTNPPLTLEDREFLAGRLELARVVGASLDRGADVRAGARSYRGAEVRGKTADYPLLEDLPLRVGRHLQEHDVVASRQVAVLGAEIAGELFPGLPDPTGRELKISDRHFRIVGVAEPRGTVMGESRDRFVVIPITAYQKLYGSRESVQIKIAAADLRQMEEAQEEARFWMRVRHRLRPLEEDDFGVMTSQQLLQIWAGISKAIYAALVPLVGISLVIGGIVLMNIMLVSVTERTREIGIRKALGAARPTILWQFMVEAVTLSMVGGLIGIGIGFAIAAIIGLVSPLPYTIAGWAVALGLAVTLAIGVIFGTFPAWKAAGLDPVEALRHE